LREEFVNNITLKKAQTNPKEIRLVHGEADARRARALALGVLPQTLPSIRGISRGYCHMRDYRLYLQVNLAIGGNKEEI